MAASVAAASGVDLATVAMLDLKWFEVVDALSVITRGSRHE